MTLAAWQPGNVEALLLPFQEPVIGQDDQQGDPQTVQAVVQRVFDRDLNAPRAPVTRHYYQLTIRSADKDKLGALNDQVTVKGEAVYIKELADAGTGVTEVICG